MVNGYLLRPPQREFFAGYDTVTGLFCPLPKCGLASKPLIYINFYHSPAVAQLLQLTIRAAGLGEPRECNEGRLHTAPSPQKGESFRWRTHFSSACRGRWRLGRSSTRSPTTSPTSTPPASRPTIPCSA